MVDKSSKVRRTGLAMNAVALEQPSAWRSDARATSKYARIREFIAASGQPGFRCGQVFDAVFRNRIGRFEDMTILPMSLRQALRAEFGESILTLRRVATRKSKQAEKALFEMPDGNRVEAIALAFQAGWESFCISSQSGCGFACSFCATGKIGLRRNMTADEITDQVLDFHLAGQDLDSIAFMGMGEPLSNKNIFAAIDLLTDRDLFALSPRRITVSTIGVVPAMKILSRDYPQVNLTLSLHSPFNDQRSSMIPLNRKYPIEILMDTLDEHMVRTLRKTYIAYVLIEGVNDTAEHAAALAALVKRRVRNGGLIHVSLIRYNTAENVTEAYRRSREKSVRDFHGILVNAGVKSTVRASFGNDIDAACGQLFANYEPRRLDAIAQMPA
jgi:23S rRNA (adenine-C8)-methyltransferase